MPVVECPTAYQVFRSGTPQAEQISGTMEEMFIRKGTSDAFYHIFTLQSLLSLWELICGAFYTQTESPASDPGLLLQKKKLRSIESRYMENLTLDDIASEGCVSKSTCCRMFRKYTGQSPIDYLNHYRLETADGLLRTTSSPITRITTACGYTGMSYFSKCFSSFYHMTPSEYRKTAD